MDNKQERYDKLVKKVHNCKCCEVIKKPMKSVMVWFDDYERVSNFKWRWEIKYDKFETSIWK